MRWNHDSDRPGRQPLELRCVTLGVVAELVAQRVASVQEDELVGGLARCFSR
jgi:hypothetical protein